MCGPFSHNLIFKVELRVYFIVIIEQQKTDHNRFIDDLCRCASSLAAKWSRVSCSIICSPTLRFRVSHSLTLSRSVALSIVRSYLYIKF